MTANSYMELYVETVKLARALGKDPSQVPQPFQLNELENVNVALKAELKAHEAAEREKAAREFADSIAAQQATQAKAAEQKAANAKTQ